MTPTWICAALMLSLGTATPQPDSEIPPLPEPDGPSMPTVERFQLPNGLSVLLMPNHANPYVEARFVARAGTSVEPPGKEGLAQLTASMLTNGTSRHGEAQIADLLESMGARVAASSSLETFEIAGSIVTLEPDDLMVFLDLFTEIVRRPSFPEASFERTRALRTSALQALSKNPAALADAALRALLYAGGVRGRPASGTLDSLPALTHGDLSSFHQRVVIPQHSVLAFAGDFDLGAMRAWIADTFGDPSWGRDVCQPSDRPGFCSQLCQGSLCYANPLASGTYSDPVAVRAAFQGIDVLVLDRGEANLSQVHWRLGQDNPVTILDPSWPAFRLGTQVLGGDFTSRLNTVLRVQEGLTYGAHYNVDFGVNDSGVMAVSTEVAPRDVRRAIDLSLRELDRVVRERIPPGELESFRRKIVNAFPFKFETITDTLEQYLYLEVAGVPSTWLETYRERLAGPGQGDVHAAMKTITPHKMSLVAVGNQDLASALTPYGRVRIVSIESFLRSGLTYAVATKNKNPGNTKSRKKTRKRRRRRR